MLFKLTMMPIQMEGSYTRDNNAGDWYQSQSFEQSTFNMLSGLKDICHGHFICYMCWGLSIHVISTIY